MIRTLTGAVITGNNETVDVEVCVGEGFVTMAARDIVVGSWPRADVAFAPLGNDTVGIAVEGERLLFKPHDMRKASQVLVARPLGSSRLMVTASAESWERAKGRSRRRAPRTIPVVVMSALIGLVATVGVVWSVRPAEAEAVNSEPTATIIAPTTTVALPTGPTLDEAMDRWDRLVGDSGLTLTGAATSIRDHVEVRLGLDDTDRISEAVVIGHISTDPRENREIVAAFGYLIGSLNPAMDAPARRSLLAHLGLDVGRLDRETVGTPVIRGDYTYVLDHDGIAGTITLSAVRTPVNDR